jgi:hypothetical protein
MLFSCGNAVMDGAPFNSWFMGDLNAWRGDARPVTSPPSFGLRLSSTVEMKWGRHQTGERRPEWAGCSDRRTMSLLVRGRFLLRFRSPVSRDAIVEQRLEREGDYAVWGTDVEHTWVVEEDAVIMTVRWKEV